MARQIQFLGQPVTPGIALGPAVILGRELRAVPLSKVKPKQVDAEIARLDDAIRRAKRDIEAQRTKAMKTLGEIVARIFEAHLMILEDEITLGQVADNIRDKHYTAQYALWSVFDEIARRFAAQKEEIFRDRAQDVHDVCRRILGYLTGRKLDAAPDVQEESILVADELGPSDVLQIDPEKVRGVVTDVGGSTSHTAILTRVLGVPSVVGLKNITSLVKASDMVIINGNSGKVFLHPTKNNIENYREKEAVYREYIQSLKKIHNLRAKTLDGHRIELAANIELPEEARNVKYHGGEGIGLFRTEYLFLAGEGVPNEKTQTEEYTRVAKAVSPRPVIIRTFDIGGDKAFPGAGIPPEANPFLGWRAIRIGLDRPEMLKAQLRAILKASAFGNIKIMFPMISDVEELRQARKYLDEAKRDLDAEGIKYKEDIEVGMMVEVPSVALLADIFAQHVDFFSIGTNDLVQFTLAVDRGNEQVAHLHTPYHPAVLQLIKKTVDAAHDNGIWVGMCGELAGDPLATLLLIGLGLDELSTSPTSIPEIKKLIRSSTKEDAKLIADKALRGKTATEVYSSLLRTMRKQFADMPIWFGRMRK